MVTTMARIKEQPDYSAEREEIRALCLQYSIGGVALAIGCAFEDLLAWLNGDESPMIMRHCIKLAAFWLDERESWFQRVEQGNESMRAYLRFFKIVEIGRIAKLAECVKPDSDHGAWILCAAAMLMDDLIWFAEIEKQFKAADAESTRLKSSARQPRGRLKLIAGGAASAPSQEGK